MANETIDVTVDSAGNIIRYYCSQAMANNVNLIGIYVPYAYELMYDCSPGSSLNLVDGIEVMEASILVKLRKLLLNTPNMCTLPQVLWFAAIDSRPVDVHVPSLNCTSFDVTNQPTGMCCDVVQGNLTLTNFSSVDQYMNEVLGAASTALIDSNNTAGYAVNYLGANLGVAERTGADNVDAAVNSEPEMPTSTPKDSEFTTLGVFVVVFLTLTTFGVIAFIVHRHRKRSELALALAGSDDEDSEMDMDDEEIPWIDRRRVPSREQADAKLLTGDDSLDFYIRSLSSQPFREPSELTDGKVDPTRGCFESAYCFEPLDVPPPETEYRQQSTAFLQNSDNPHHQQQQQQQRQQKARSRVKSLTYSIGGISAIPAYASNNDLGVVSDNNSDTDSWAQTEGTIGSLEERELP